MRDLTSPIQFQPTPHPVLRVPEPDILLRLSPEESFSLLTQREELIKREQEDPFRFGFEPPRWKRVDDEMQKLRSRFVQGVIEELDLGGNRASKSERAAKRIIQLMVNKPGAKVWCCASTQEISRQTQQPLLWKYLPKEWKPTSSGKLRQGVTTKIVYTQAGGFTEDTFVLPNGSQCWFKYYSQDVKTLEGPELDAAWCDELVTPEWLEALRYRLITRSGVLHTTFTPVEGYNATVKEYLTGAKTLEQTEAELLPDGNGGFEKVPLIQQPLRPQALIFYFHTKDNPYGNYESMKATLEGRKRVDILCRAYGVPTKAIANRFVKFSDRVHVIDKNLIPKEGTRYQIIDPCGGRNWFMSWFLVDPAENLYLYREWPCPSTYIEGIGLPGHWAEPDGKKSDGKRGMAQQTFGFGLKRYKDEILKLENQEDIFERYMDSRYGNSKTVGKENPTTLIEECEEIGMTFLPTPGDNIDEGIDLINSALDYDTTKPISALNRPRLYISSECENTIYALREWTGQDGRHGACKDPIDNLRYFFLLDLAYCSAKTLQTTGGGSY